MPKNRGQHRVSFLLRGLNKGQGNKRNGHNSILIDQNTSQFSAKRCVDCCVMSTCAPTEPVLDVTLGVFGRVSDMSRGTDENSYQNARILHKKTK